MRAGSGHVLDGHDPGSWRQACHGGWTGQCFRSKRKGKREIKEGQLASHGMCTEGVEMERKKERGTRERKGRSRTTGDRTGARGEGGTHSGDVKRIDMSRGGAASSRTPAGRRPKGRSSFRWRQRPRHPPSDRRPDARDQWR